MTSTRQRLVAFLLIVFAGALMIAIPRLGDAQEATPSAVSPEASALITRGDEIYHTICLACHQPEGQGVTDVTVGGIPALAGNPFVTIDDPRPVVQTVLNGRAGMPSFRGFSDEEIAGVVSYIRQAWGNQAAPVDPAIVTEVRAQFTVPPPPDATPIATELAGSLAPPDDGTTPEADGSPEVPGGAQSGGITPVPTVGQ